MEVSTDIVERITIGAVAAIVAVGTWAFRFLRNEISAAKIEMLKHDSTIHNDLDRIDNSFQQHKERVHARLDKQEEKILAAIEKLSGAVTPLHHCESRQELWRVRFDNMMEMNGEQHENITDMMLGVKEEIKVLQDCVTKLGKNREC